MPTSTAILHLRITPRNKRLLQQAATASHASTLTEYVVSSALRQAEQDLLERKTFTMKSKDWDKFNERLEAPARTIAPLKKLAEAPHAFRGTA
jgi:uncharacterized protein (DUF1778 family)